MAAGYGILRELLDILEGRMVAVNTAMKDALLLDATNRFYNAIPHQFSAYHVPPVIRYVLLMRFQRAKNGWMTVFF